MKFRDVAWAALAVLAGIIVFAVVTDLSVAHQAVRSAGLAASEDPSLAYARAQGIFAGVFVIIIGVWAVVSASAERRAKEIERRRAQRK